MSTVATTAEPQAACDAVAGEPTPGAPARTDQRRAAALRRRGRTVSGLTRLRPGVSFSYTLCLASAALVLPNPLQAACVLLLVIAALAASRRLRAAWPYARVALYIGVAVVLLNPLLASGGLDVLCSWHLGPLELRVSTQSLAYGLSSGIRLMAVILAFALLNLVVDPDDQLAIMSRLSFRSGVVLSLASRLLPVFSKDATRITDAQRSRGVQLDCGRRRDRVAARIPLLACMLSQSLERAIDVAASMESRGYGAGQRSRWLRARPWRVADIASSTATLLVAAALLAGLASGAFSYTFFPLLEDPRPHLLGAAWLIVLICLCTPLVVTKPWRRSRP